MKKHFRPNTYIHTILYIPQSVRASYTYIPYYIFQSVRASYTYIPYYIFHSLSEPLIHTYHIIYSTVCQSLLYIHIILYIPVCQSLLYIHTYIPYYIFQSVRASYTYIHTYHIIYSTVCRSLLQDMNSRSTPTNLEFSFTQATSLMVVTGRRTAVLQLCSMQGCASKHRLGPMLSTYLGLSHKSSCAQKTLTIAPHCGSLNDVASGSVNLWKNKCIYTIYNMM